MTAKRKIMETALGGRKVKVYWSAEYSEFCCRLYVDGTLYGPADYFTADKADAIDTAFAMVQPLEKG